jgi:hypothetical protein
MTHDSIFFANYRKRRLPVKSHVSDFGDKSERDRSGMHAIAHAALLARKEELQRTQ